MSLKLGSQILSNNGTLPSTSEEKTLIKGFIKGKLNKIKELEIDKDKFYSIDDLPDNSITNEMMEAVLSDNKTAAFFALNNTYVCIDDGNYKKGTTYKFNGDSWEEISSGGGGIATLVGTVEKPINLVTDMEVGKLYLISGYVWTQYTQNIKKNWAADGVFLPAFRTKDFYNRDAVVIQGISISSRDWYSVNAKSRGFVCSVILDIETYNITGMMTTTSITRFNQNSQGWTPTSADFGFFAPTKSGTQGQILQSNGDAEPIWVDANFEHKLTKETYNISNWTTLSDAAPYTYSTTITATYTIGEDTEVELINDNAVLFAKYGFAIASVNGQEITVYSVTQPSEEITLTIGFRG